MSKLPRITVKEAVRAVEKPGFSLSRQSGGHRIYKNKQGKRVTPPYHAGKVLHPKIIKSIVNDAGISVEEFRRYLK